MKRIQAWQAIVLALAAVVIAIWTIYRSLGQGERGAPIPSVAGGVPPAAASGTSANPPLPPASFPGAPPSQNRR